MNENLHKELISFLEEKKDETQSYVLCLLNKDGKCYTMTNAQPIALAFMIKSLDTLYDQVTDKINQSKIAPVMELKKTEGRPSPLE